MPLSGRSFAALRLLRMTGECSAHEAAVDGDDLAGDVGGVHEMQHGLGDLLRPAEAAQRDLPGEVVQRLLPEHLHHVGVDHARGDAVDADAGRGELRREGARQADDRVLGGGIARLAGGAVAAPDRGDVHDAARVRVQHRPDHGLRAVEAAVHVHIEDAPPGLLPDVLELLLFGDARVVDEQAHGPELALDMAHHALDRGAVGDVRLLHEHLAPRGAQPRGELLGLVAALDEVDAHGPALAAERRRDGGPDAAGRARDQRDLLHVPSTSFRRASMRSRL